ncbi:hypothetical protein GZH47_32375 (plasmid) [Paenibacillus rhizovicinus]|uniref:Uncharacterized protein n=1 Tax=Paenibacillus rhizovicinus TaxID=2704463 RepID=A0A6C0PCG1_9BACL|nr:hypothetical protein [Paenibacillus rhizovicinus]QHW35583.1 hypothetical protein GZH47_32375 [Paenibacillus rhizovicinus]
MKKSDKPKATLVRKRTKKNEGFAKQQIDSNINELEWLDEKRPDHKRKPRY